MLPFFTHKIQQELAGCSHTAKKRMLSLTLQNSNWDDIIDNKRDRALNKLSKLFGVPKVCINITNQPIDCQKLIDIFLIN